MAWKTTALRGVIGKEVIASMGPRFNGVEDRGRESRGSFGDTASMGPRFNGVEDDQRRGAESAVMIGFNGATL